MTYPTHEEIAEWRTQVPEWGLSDEQTNRLFAAAENRNQLETRVTEMQKQLAGNLIVMPNPIPMREK